MSPSQHLWLSEPLWCDATDQWHQRSLRDGLRGTLSRVGAFFLFPRRTAGAEEAHVLHPAPRMGVCTASLTSFRSISIYCIWSNSVSQNVNGNAGS